MAGRMRIARGSRGAAALIAFAIGCSGGNASKTTHEDDGQTPGKTEAEAGATPEARVNDDYLLLKLRAVRIFDDHAPADPDDLPHVVSNYPKPSPLWNRIDSLDLEGVDHRSPPPIIIDETQTIAVRARGDQTFDLGFGGDYRILLQASGFTVSHGGAMITPQLRFKSNYQIVLPGETGRVYRTFGRTEETPIGATIMWNLAGHRAGQLFMGTWLAISFERLGAIPPTGTTVAEPEPKERYEARWKSWQTIEKAGLTLAEPEKAGQP